MSSEFENFFKAYYEYKMKGVRKMETAIITREQILAAVSCAGYDAIEIRKFQTLIKKLQLKWQKLDMKIDVKSPIDEYVFLKDDVFYYMLEDKVEGENYYERVYLRDLPFGTSWQIKKDVKEILETL